MMKRALLQAEILEKLGAPLAAAVGEVAARGGQEASSPREEAQKTAALLGKAVQLGTMIATKANVKGGDESADSVRAALTALAGRLVADYYRRTARMPEEGDLQKIASSLEATLAFSDNFVASAETVARISQMSAGTVYADENQLLTQFASALTPVINAAATFPFGQPEAALVQKVAERLTEKAGTLIRKMRPEKDAPRPDTASLSELTILQALVSIYVACHYEGIEHMKKHNALSSGAAPADPMAHVWDMFEKRVAMMDMLAQYIVQDRSGAAASPPPAESVTPSVLQGGGDSPSSVQNQSMNVPPVLPPQTAPIEEKVPEENTEKNENENPMSFFGSAKKTGDDE